MIFFFLKMSHFLRPRWLEHSSEVLRSEGELQNSPGSPPKVSQRWAEEPPVPYRYTSCQPTFPLKYRVPK